MEDANPNLDEAAEAALVRAVFDDGARGVAIIDKELRVARFSRGFGVIADRGDQDLHGMAMAELFPLAMRALAPVIEEVRKTGKPRLSLPAPYDWANLVVDVRRIDESRTLLVVSDPRGRPFDAKGGALRTRHVFFEVSRSLARASASDMSTALEGALRAISEAYDLDRAWVRLLSEDQRTLKLAHAYAREGLAAEAPQGELDANTCEAARARLAAGEAVVLIGPGSDEQGDEATRQAFHTMGLASALAVPVLDGPAFLGYVTYASTNARKWPPPAISRLKLSAEMIGGAVVRYRAEALLDRLAFELLLSSVTARFVNVAADRLDREIGIALEQLGESRHFDRAAVFQLDAAAGVVRTTHHWNAPGVTSLAEDFGTRPLSELTNVTKRVFAGEASSGSRDHAPPGSDAAEVLDRMNAQAYVMVPLAVDGHTSGLVTLQRVQRASALEFDATRVRLIADVFAQALAKRAATERLRASEARLSQVLEEVSRQKRTAERERDYLREERSEDGAILGESVAMRAALDMIEAVASSNATVLLLGESGVGKELFANRVHERSRRAHAPFVKVNCASVPRTLFESEFFGHARGSFTGAHKDRVGRFELADKGTLFLDEVGEIPLEQQAKLLRVLQEGEFERVGEDRTRKLDVRVVAATNRNLEKEVEEGRFRRDLYFRLSVFPLPIPPLRERGEDMVLLARHFLARHATRARREGLSLSKADEARLEGYSWPGNVREFDHVIERAVLLSREGRLSLELALPSVIPPRDTPPPAVPAAPAPEGILRDEEIRKLERESILAALSRAEGRVSGAGGAAELLGVSPSTLRDRMRAFRIQR